MVTELCPVQEFWKKNNQWGITWKQIKGEQSFLSVTHCPDLIHIPIKLHEGILNYYRIMAPTRMFGKINQRGITWKIRKGGTIILVHDTSS